MTLPKLTPDIEAGRSVFLNKDGVTSLIRLQISFPDGKTSRVLISTETAWTLASQLMLLAADANPELVEGR